MISTRALWRPFHGRFSGEPYCPLSGAVADCSRMGWGGSSRTLTTTS